MHRRVTTYRHWERTRTWCPIRLTRAALTRADRDVTNGDMEIRFTASDGVPLVGTLYEAKDPRGAVLIAPATGILARFYSAFAQWLADERQLTALTFDYRGIGKSLVGKLSECEATKVQWGQEDLTAALDALAHHAPGLPLYLVGNSAGGQLIGLMRNVRKLERIVQVASSSGHLKHLDFPLRIVAPILMKGVMPVSNRILGYSISKKLGWGEDLPRHVARQWAEWCSGPGYVENDFGRAITEHHYYDITAPILNLSFTDDPIANDHNVDDLIRLFTKARMVKRRIDPHEVGMKEVGHLGFFRRSAKALWPIVGDFLDAQDSAAQSVPSREPARRSALGG